MGNLVCLLVGHKRALVAFSSNRFYCPRCGLDLGVQHFQPAKLDAMPLTRVKRDTARQLRR